MITKSFQSIQISRREWEDIYSTLLASSKNKTNSQAFLIFAWFMMVRQTFVLPSWTFANLKKACEILFLKLAERVKLTSSHCTSCDFSSRILELATFLEKRCPVQHCAKSARICSERISNRKKYCKKYLQERISNMERFSYHCSQSLYRNIQKPVSFVPVGDVVRFFWLLKTAEPENMFYQAFWREVLCHWWWS